MRTLIHPHSHNTVNLTSFAGSLAKFTALRSFRTTRYAMRLVRYAVLLASLRKNAFNVRDFCVISNGDGAMLCATHRRYLLNTRFARKNEPLRGGFINVQ